MDLVTRPVAILDMAPPEKALAVSHLATILTDIIEKQKLFSVIQGKKHVKVEGWATIGSFLGVYPREKSVTECDDGSYIAEVELIRGDSGRVIGGASSLCSVTEKRWGNAEAYARRSMAVTRATGKAFRLSFAWIAAMSGYEATPAEEMPQPAEDRVYRKDSPSLRNDLGQYLQTRNIPEDHHDKISELMDGRDKADIITVLKDYIANNQS